MKKLFTHVLPLLACLIPMLAMTACSDKNEEIIDNTDWSKPADHTLLMYIVGDNNINDVLEGNVSATKKYVRDSIPAGKLNIVVMKDDKQGDGLPVLFWLHRNAKADVDTVMIKKWDKDVNTASPAFLAEVLKLTFSDKRFDTKIKGISLGSHALSWLPSSNFKKAPQRRSFGYDESVVPAGSIELWDLSATLAQGPKLDYIIMDCCHMGTAEAAYQMRDVAHYMVACPTEVEGRGIIASFPTSSHGYGMLTSLAQCQDVNSLPQALSNGMHQYFDYHDKHFYGATVSLYDLTKMDALATAVKPLIQSRKAMLYEAFQKRDASIIAQMKELQYFGRNEEQQHSRYYFFDLDLTIDWLTEGDATAAHKAIKDVVLQEYHSSSFRKYNGFHGIDIKYCCGMAISIPETLLLADDVSYFEEFKSYERQSSKLLAAYHLTDWGAFMGY